MKASTAFNRKITALTAFNRENSEVKRRITDEIAALTAFFVGIEAFTAFNGKNKCVNGV